MSWHGPSAPRVEGIATKSRVVASCASKAGVDGVENFLIGVAGVHCVGFPAQSVVTSDQSIIQPELPASSDRFQNRRAAHTVAADHHARRRYRMPGNRNVLFLIIGALIVAVGVLGYNLYQTKKQPEGLQINVGPNGLKIESK